MPTIRVQEDPDYGLESKVGSIILEHGVRGTELRKEIEDATGKFIRAMELRGCELYHYPGLQNPTWISSEDGELVAYYAIDWEGKRKAIIGPDGLPLPRTRETSLEDSEGEVEYRIVGIFWTPQRAVEFIKNRYQIFEEEKLARQPTQYGYGGRVEPQPENPKEYEKEIENDR